MEIGILSFRDKKYYPNKRLIEAASIRGHNIFLLNPKKCFSHILENNLKVISPAERLDVLLPRVGAGIDQYTLSMVRHFELQGTHVVNGFMAIVQARNNFLTLQTLASSGIGVPETLYVNNVKNFKKALQYLGGYPVILKTINSRQGNGVVLVDSRSTAEFIVSAFEGTGYGLLAQEYYDPRGRKDIRVFVLGGKAIGAVELYPREGDFRANFHLNAVIKPLKLDRQLRQIAEKASRTMGFEISGVDIVLTEAKGPVVIEVNYSPGFHGLELATGLDVAGKIIDYLERTFGG